MRAALALLLVLGASTAPASGARRCAEGTFVVDGAPLMSAGAEAPGADAVVIAGKQVSIASGCPPVRARVKRSPRGTAVRAAWESCGALAGEVRLKAHIDRACRRITGLLAAGGARRRFTATRFPTCGNGVREADEQCDDGNTTDGDCCDASCRLEESAACAPAGCTTSADCTGDGYCEKAPGDCAGAGACRQQPGACIGVLEPVCGCDGRTYVNACEAARAGVSVRAEGRCEPRCGTIAGISCPEGQFCELPPGTCEAADLEGRCIPVPLPCPLFHQPVCGCDGVTYDNDCQRQAAKAEKAHDGPCECPAILCPDGEQPVDRDGDGCPDTCRAPCEKPCDCYLNPFLHFPHPCPLACANCDNYWVCEGGFCEDHCGPVPLGQDQCPAPPPCKTSADCAATAYCAKPEGACDREGACQPRPQSCPDVSAPVCGCDGTTYPNACAAAAAGVSVASPGPCPQRCGTIAGIPCPEGEFCEFPPGTCDAADLEGRCVAIPTACPEFYFPVCGCDGVTYGNDCERRAARAEKAHDGECACPLILCEPGTVPHDTDGDGCPDTCVPGECRDACDCYGLPFVNPCPLLCPACGSYWTCEQGRCVEHCGVLPPQICTTGG